MRRTPRLVVPLWLAGAGTATPVGNADLSLAAAGALAMGRRWDSDEVPPSFDVLGSLGHAGRRAAIRGLLTSPGLPQSFDAFANEAARWGRFSDLRRALLSHEKAALDVSRAAWLLQTVSGAHAAPWPPEPGHVAHPVTGDIEPSALAAAWTEPPGPPFAFLTQKLKFAGVRWEDLRDFLGEGGDAISYLALCVADPGAVFADIALLDSLTSASDAEADAEVARWNARQDVWLRTADFRGVALPDGAARADAERWCREDLALAAYVRDSLLDSRR